MKSLCLAILLTIAMAQQSMAVVVNLPKTNQPRTDAAYYYHGRYYPYYHHALLSPPGLALRSLALLLDRALIPPF